MTDSKGVKPIEQKGRNLGGMDFFLLWAGPQCPLPKSGLGGS